MHYSILIVSVVTLKYGYYCGGLYRRVKKKKTEKFKSPVSKKVVVAYSRSTHVIDRTMDWHLGTVNLLYWTWNLSFNSKLGSESVKFIDLLRKCHAHLSTMLTLGNPTQGCRHSGHVECFDASHHCARQKRQKLCPQLRVVGSTINSKQQLHCKSCSERLSSSSLLAIIC